MGVEERREEARRIVEEASRLAGKAEGVEAGGYREDLEALKEVLSTITEFLNRLNEPLEKLINTVLSALDGEKVGRDVGAFYRSLVESGVPQEEAVRLTREYFKARVDSVNVASLLRSLLEEGAGKGEG